MARVLMLFYEPSPAGQATQVLSLVKCLDKERYQIKVAYPQRHVSMGKVLEDLGVPAVRLPMGRLNNVGAAMTLLRLMREEPFDILHVHGHEAGLWGRIVGRLARVRGIVYTPHTLESGVIWRRAYLGIERALAPLTDAWISVSNADRLTLIERGIAAAHKICTVHNGVDSSFLPRRDPMVTRRSLSIPDGVPVVVQVGRLSTQKGPKYFLQAAARALKQNPDIRFLLVGDGPLREKMQGLARRLSATPSVTFLGWREDADDVMASADLVVLSSLWEGLPYVLLEAMALGKPVIASNVGGNPELVEHERTGLLVTPRDEALLARAILALIGDPVTARGMGQAGKQRVREHFSLVEMTKLTQQVYDSLLSSHRGGSC